MKKLIFTFSILSFFQLVSIAQNLNDDEVLAEFYDLSQILATPSYLESQTGSNGILNPTQQVIEPHRRTFTYSHSGHGNTGQVTYVVIVNFKTKGTKFYSKSKPTSYIRTSLPLISWDETYANAEISGDGKELNWEVHGKLQLGIVLKSNHFGFDYHRVWSGTIHLDDFGHFSNDDIDSEKKLTIEVKHN